MYGVIHKSDCKKKVKKNDVDDEPQVKPCPKCGEDFVKMHSAAFNPLLMRTGPRPWTGRKDDNF